MAANDQIKAFIDRVIRLKEEQDELSSDIRDVYAEAKAMGYDKTAMGEVVAYLRKVEKKGKDAVAERGAIFDMYLEAYERPSHTHAREGRSDAGLNIVTKHTGIQVPSSEQSEGNGSRDHQHVHSRQTDGAKHGGQDGEPAGADHATYSPETAKGETGMVLGTGRERPLSIGLHTDGDPEARFETASLHQDQQMDRATEGSFETGSEAAEKGREAIPAGPEGVDLNHAGAGESPATPSDQFSEGGADEVERSAPRAGIETHTSNTGEGAANTALPAKPKFVLRPYCRNPGEGCGGSGTTHCHSCLKAREEVAA